ncbi:Apoptosis antagonizing transcription factor [Carabus blaptoides fortunei]
MISKTKKQETLSDKIVGILNTAPQSFDPEDDIYEETRAQIVENDEQNSDDDNDEVSLSRFRKQNIDLLEDVDKKYAGKKGSRKSLQDSDEWETEDEGLSTDEGEALDGVSGTQEVPSSDTDNDELNSDNENKSSGDSDEDDGSEVGESFDGEIPEDDVNFKHMSDTNVSGQVKKGNCVRNQLSIWENLLETRIQLQKCLITSNKLPQFDVFENFNVDNDFKAASTKTKHIITKALNNFLILQSLLLKQYPETKSLLKESNSAKIEEGSDEEIPSDSDAEMESEKEEESDEEEKMPKKRRKLIDFEQDIRTRHDKYKDYRNTIIQKWHDKTRLMIAKNNAGSTSILQHINYVLDDRSKLVRRTQLKRSEYDVIGKEKSEDINTESEKHAHPSKLPEEYDTEIYDDDDFYHQLLRELIEFKSTDVTDPVQMSRQWIALQNLRSKMKRKIDTKATKGRKIRYAVHSKLINFMAPIDNSSWTDEAKTELYASLFGNNRLNKSTT